MADNVDPDPPPPPPDVPHEVAVTTPTATPLPADAPPPRQGCMAKRSGLEKCLIVLFIIIIIICILFAAAFVVFYLFAIPPEGTCLSDKCMTAASRIKKYMDKSVEPCNNFYEYACGNWLKEQELDQDESKIDFQTRISDANNVKLKRVLDVPVDEVSDEIYLKKPRRFYKGCMNMGRLKSRGTKPFIELMDSVASFPLFKPTWNESDFDLEGTLVNLTKLGLMPIVTVGVQRDLRQSDINRIYISDASLNLVSKTRYADGRKSEMLVEYERWLINSLVLLGVDKAVADEKMKQVIDLEIQIAALMRDDVVKSANWNNNYNQRTVAVLQKKYPWMEWQTFFQGFVGNVTRIGIEDVIIDTEPNFLEKIGTLLESTPKEILANYMMTNLIRYTRTLYDDFVKLSDEYTEKTTKTKPRPRWEYCVTQTVAIFPDFVSRMYVDNFFSPSAKEDVTKIIGNLIASFREMLKDIDWMTEQTKKEAFTKLEKMKAKVGYPEYLKDTKKLNTMYGTISASEHEYMKTVIEHKVSQTIENVKQLKGMQDKSKWIVAAATVNAHYNALTNEMLFPAAFLQEPVYSPEFTDSMNYGRIGVVIGHEMTHGYDTVGRQYDSKGELKPKGWWTKEDKEKYDKKTECFVDQYSCFRWNGHSISGELTLSENIADNGGLKQSYRAYRNVINKRGEEELTLPGLKLNHKQIFFLSFAQMWCTKVREKIMEDILKTDNHAPLEYRVMGTLQNSKEFSEAFGCGFDSRMNRGNKCVIW